MTDFGDLVDLVLSINNRELLEDFLLGLTTDKERHDLAQRVEIVKRLLSHETQKDIAKELGVGVATVTRGSKELAQGRFKVMKEESDASGKQS